MYEVHTCIWNDKPTTETCFAQKVTCQSLLQSIRPLDSEKSVLFDLLVCVCHCLPVN